MEKGIICRIRDISRAISELDTVFMHEFGVNINEAMSLCVLLNKEQMSASEIAEELCVTMSNASKIIRSVEEKGFVSRELGKEDHRKMLFNLTKEGREKIETMHACDIALPDILKSVL